MRKWMRDRLQRRKKKPSEASDQPAPPPLQPAYFDAEAPGASESNRSGDSESDNQPEESTAATADSQPSGEDVDQRTSDQMQPPRDSSPRSASRNAGQSGRGRRRRGGRGRGGRGREQAVAEAFTPSAIKGSIPEAKYAIEPSPEDQASGSAEGDIAQPLSAAPPVATVPPVARAPKGVVVLAIGLPGSGKSSWFKRHNVVPLSSDMMRTLLFDDIREQRYQDLVFSNLRSLLKARLISKRPMNYVDATNLTPHERQHWIKLAKDYGYEVHAVFFDVPLEVCIERHHRRDRVVPDDVMRRMATKLKPPSFEEGFAKITVVRVKKKDSDVEPHNAS